MKKILTGLFLLSLSLTTAHAQKFVSDAQSFGKIDKADLELKSCDFEKDANAMVLFDKGDLYYDDNLNIVIEHHKRIKIFNDNGKKSADVRLEYYGGNRYEYITGLQGQIYNLVDGKVEVTKLEKKQIFTENVDKYRMAMVFSFPNVKPGSVIEFKYTQTINSDSSIPNWYFQDDIPVKYSELQTTIPEWFYFTIQQRAFHPYAKRNKLTKSRSFGGGANALLFTENMEQYVMANVESIAREPFMTSRVDNLQSLYFQLTHFNPPAGFSKTYSNSWAKVGGRLAEDEDFGGQLKRKLTGEAAIIDKAKTFKTDEQKIAYVFNEVKNTMKWNNSDDWYTDEGIVKAWDKKIGNSTEVNLILYRLLKQSGVNAYPMVVSTRSHGKVNPVYSFLYQFNRGVVYVPVDSAKRYVLDATSKYNTYFDIPAEVVGSYGLYIDKDNKKFDLISLQRTAPVRKVLMLNAQILPEGKMDGTAMINSFSYHRAAGIENYKTNGEKKYIEYLRDNDNTLSITSLKLDNMDVDSLPLLHNIAFKQELTGSDKDYIYFSSNIFTSMHSNPFLSENRITDIDFGHLNSYNLTGIFKLPAGYKLEALPKSVSLQMPDQSISCRRIVAEENGTLMIRYLINYNKSLFFKDDYPPIHDFYKKMYELLNEKVVLKKS